MASPFNAFTCLETVYVGPNPEEHKEDIEKALEEWNDVWKNKIVAKSRPFYIWPAGKLRKVGVIKEITVVYRNGFAFPYGKITWFNDGPKPKTTSHALSCVYNVEKYLRSCVHASYRAEQQKLLDIVNDYYDKP